MPLRVRSGPRIGLLSAGEVLKVALHDAPSGVVSSETNGYASQGTVP